MMLDDYYFGCALRFSILNEKNVQRTSCCSTLLTQLYSRFVKTRTFAGRARWQRAEPYDHQSEVE